MPKFVTKSQKKLFQKLELNKLGSVFVLLILIAALPLTIIMSQHPQTVQQHASTPSCNSTDGPFTCKSNGKGVPNNGFICSNGATRYCATDEYCKNGTPTGFPCVKVSCTCYNSGRGAPYNNFSCKDGTGTIVINNQYCASNEICTNSKTSGWPCIKTGSNPTPTSYVKPTPTGYWRPTPTSFPTRIPTPTTTKCPYPHCPN